MRPHGLLGCYRLMKIGEGLEYGSLTERRGKLIIEEGMEAWATYVRTQRAFLIAWATQEALALCRALAASRSLTCRVR